MPEGLFKCAYDDNPESYIQEIRSDLLVLNENTNANSVQFLASRIARKINVLVCLCQLHEKKIPQSYTASLTIQTLATRQQWLQQLEHKIHSLEEQKQSLARRLTECLKRSPRDDQAILILQKDLGELEKQITLAKETEKKMTS
ncbi:hypothetical protein GCM10007966_17270 [Legionella impletisoli]|uniref:Coiled-coil protein n=1 Tax=Legionella impletisoli TaxID=343510 RepID=A0A917NCX2_9GAMM|nr:hypothetical protein GCM10007966_17270 [Legionella impletisoli]